MGSKKFSLFDKVCLRGRSDSVGTATSGVRDDGWVSVRWDIDGSYGAYRASQLEHVHAPAKVHPKKAGSR